MPAGHTTHWGIDNMKKVNLFFIIGFTVMALGTIKDAIAKDDSEKGQLFTIPFLLDAQSTADYAQADFTLKSPAVLEFIYVACSGLGNIGWVQTDGGPLGINGTTGTASGTGVLLVGETGQMESDVNTKIYLEFVQGSTVFNDYLYKSQTRLSIPVKAKFSLWVGHDGTAGSNQVTCIGTFAFRGL